MIRPTAIISLIFFLGLGLYAQTQPLSTLRKLETEIHPGPLQIDSFPIIPASIIIKKINTNILLDSSFYELKGNSLFFSDSLPFTNALISYRILPYRLDEIVSRLDTGQIQRIEDGIFPAFDYNPYEEEETLIDFKKLDYAGSFARGISFGNSQNLVLNSSFNLQLAGDIGDDVEILAAITDENIPLQPEGNTQQLQEFDKIFVQLKRKNHQLIAGDYELGRPEGYFMNYYKKLQGATYSGLLKLDNEAELKSSASIAIARGKFSRNILDVKEGNQGPYRLRGNEGERFIIVLAGTEKVFIDGRLLTRGIEEDYVINYNRSDLTFTNKNLITKDSRVIVEFEYSDQNYLRSLYALNTEYRHKNFNFYLNVYSEQDGKNSSGESSLSDENKQVLKEAGDDLRNAYVPSLDTLEEGFSSYRVMYYTIDTFICGIPTQILRYSTSPDSVRYVARFTEVGFGNGNYTLDTEQAANERVYKWVSPIGCQPQGNYSPVIRLTAPKQKQLYTLGANYQPGKNTSIQTEIALSNNDLNRFSREDAGDNVGLAGFTQLEKHFQLGKAEKGWSLETGAKYEFTQESFSELNPYRNPEFMRDWNLSSSYSGSTEVQEATEHIGSGSFTLKKSQVGNLKYQFSSFFRDSIYTGTRHYTGLQLQYAGFEISAEASLLNTETVADESNFFRPKIQIAKTFKRLKNWKAGVYGEQEKNKRYGQMTDTLSSNSFYYDLYRLFLESPVNDKLQFNLQYSQRFDHSPLNTLFEKTSTASELNLNGQWKQKKISDFSWNVTYRDLEINDSTLTQQQAQETYLGRINHNLNLFKGAIRSNTSYEIGSGQEAKVEYRYLPVNPGEGTFFWNNLNSDSIVQLNEVEIAPYQDQANLVRITLFTDEFIRSNNVVFNQNFRLSPKAVWFREEGIKKLLSRFSTQSTFRITRKTREVQGVSPWNPFQLTIPDSALVAVSSNVRNTLFFNRADPKYDLQLGQSDNQNRVILTTGYESRRTLEQFVRGRWNITQKVSTLAKISTGRRENDSEFFNNKDYRIQHFKATPQLTYLFKTNFRAVLTYTFENSKNTLPETDENMLNHDFNLELTLNLNSKKSNAKSGATSIRAKTSFVKVKFDGMSNSPVGFAMLQGLQNGRNYLWNISIDKRLSRNIQLNLSYEGRKTGSANVVHVGRAQVAATF